MMLSRRKVLRASLAAPALIFANPVRALGTSGEPMVQHFAANGCGFPTLGTVTYPSMSYFADTDTTWFSWESNNFGTNQRKIMAKTYDHAAQEWSHTYQVGLDPLVDDHHGPSSIERDHQGYVYAFFGSHFTPLKVSRTTNPNDVTGWTILSDLGTDTSYPKANLVGSTMYVFFRKLNGSPRPLRMAKTTELSGGSPTWGSEIEILNWGNPSGGTRCYAQNFVKVGTDLHFLATRASQDASFLQGIFYFIYDTTDGSVRNIDGSVVVAAGSLPIGFAQTKADFAVEDQEATGKFTIFNNSMEHDTSGNVHVAYGSGDSASGPFETHHKMWNGSAWSSATVINGALGNQGGHVVPMPNGVIDVYFQGDGLIDGSSSVYRSRRSAAGEWSGEVLVRQDTGMWPVATSAYVRNGRSGARIVLHEVTSGNEVEGGDLKLWAYDPDAGGSGYLRCPVAKI